MGHVGYAEYSIRGVGSCVQISNCSGIAGPSQPARDPFRHDYNVYRIPIFYVSRHGATTTEHLVIRMGCYNQYFCHVGYVPIQVISGAVIIEPGKEPARIIAQNGATLGR